jgi:hypothetical protein
MTPKLRISLCLTLVAALSSVASHAWAQQCSTQTTKGRYVVVASGFLTPQGASSLVPAKLLATAAADQTGHFTGSGTLMVGGGPAVTQTVDGMEVINGNCTGSITYATKIDGQFVGYLDFHFVVSQHGNRIDGLATDAGTVLAAVLTRISRNHEDRDADTSRSMQAKPATIPVLLRPKALSLESAAAARITVPGAQRSTLRAAHHSG